MPTDPQLYSEAEPNDPVPEQAPVAQHRTAPHSLASVWSGILPDGSPLHVSLTSKIPYPLSQYINAWAHMAPNLAKRRLSQSLRLGFDAICV